jgi:hypothetical protein
LTHIIIEFAHPRAEATVLAGAEGLQQT